MPTGFPPLSPLFPKVTPKSCLKGFPACHRNHSGTHSIDVVSNCSCGQWFRLSCLTMEFHAFTKKNLTCSLVIRTTPSIAALIQLMWFQNDLAAIPVVLVGVTSFIPTRQQHSSRRQQQANSRQAPEAIRFLAVVGEETTSKRRTNDV